MGNNTPFPLRGIIGVVTRSADEVESAATRGLQCIELRADCLLDAGYDIEQIYAMISRARDSQINALFTLRHPSHGGTFNGSEQQRAELSLQALDRGASMIDLEWQSEAAQQVTDRSSLILSHHDFSAMPDDAQLASITHAMSAEQPRAIKVVPTASSVSDAIRMLVWTASSDSSIARIGFAMGAAGAVSRILAPALGGPITYTAFGAANAPGQIEMLQLLNGYRAMDMDGNTSVIAVVGDEPSCSQQVETLNRDYASEQQNTVAVGFPAEAAAMLEQNKDQLNIAEIRSI